MNVSSEDIDEEIHNAALHSRGLNLGKRRPTKSHAAVARKFAELREMDEVKAQHGPVKQIMKDGKPCH